MKTIGETYKHNNLEIRFIYGIETPIIKIDLGIVTTKNDDYNKFHTIVDYKNLKPIISETHFDIDHLISNLLCYNISLNLIETLIEREIGLESLSFNPLSKEVISVIDNNSNKYHHDIMYSFWEYHRNK